MENNEAKNGRGDGDSRGGDVMSTVGLDLEAKRAQLIELLEVQIVGQTLATIKTKNELMRSNVDGVKMEKLDNGGEVKSPAKGKLDAMGMMLCQTVKRMIEFGGDELAIMLEIDFDVVSFQSERQAKFNKLDSENKLNALILEDTQREPCAQKRDDEIKFLMLEKKHELRAARVALLRSKRTRGEPEQSENETEKAAAQKQMDLTLEEYVDDVTYREMGKYRVAVAEYEKRLEEVKIAKRCQKLLLDEQSVEQLMLARLSGYIAVINSIVNKIKEYVSHVPEILSAVSMVVRLKGTSITISNPYESSNLSGLLQNMMSKYFKPSFVTFQQSLLEALNLRISEQGLRDDPVKIVQDVGRIISTWEALKYWNFMTPDMFFTTVLLNALPEGKERSSVAQPFPWWIALDNAHLHKDCMVHMSPNGHLNLPPGIFVKMFELMNEAHPDSVLCVHTTKVVENVLNAQMYFKFTDSHIINKSLVSSVRDNDLVPLLIQQRSERFKESIDLSNKSEQECRQLAAIVDSEVDLVVYGKVNFKLTFDGSKKVVGIDFMPEFTSMNTTHIPSGYDEIAL